VPTLKATANIAEKPPMGLPFLAGYMISEHGRRSAMIAGAADANAVAAGAQKNDVYKLHDRVERLTLVVAAMWSMLEDQGMTEAQLMERIREIDAADGTPDGKITHAPVDCTGCGAKVPAELAACQFCGVAIEGGGSNPFATI
jgi:hypothetical protein